MTELKSNHIVTCLHPTIILLGIQEHFFPSLVLNTTSATNLIPLRVEYCYVYCSSRRSYLDCYSLRLDLVSMGILLETSGIEFSNSQDEIGACRQSYETSCQSDTKHAQATRLCEIRSLKP